MMRTFERSYSKNLSLLRINWDLILKKSNQK